MTIVANSLCLALYDYESQNSEVLKNKILDYCAQVFNCIFILECILKIAAKGFVVHKESYLRDWWNILDFIVAISAILEFLPLGTSSSSFRGIRSIRAIRPLRSVNAIPSMKKLVKILLKSLPNLATVVMLLTFMMLIFGVLGLHFFNGYLYYRCRITETPVNATYWPMLQDYEHLCTQTPDSCPQGTWCGHPQDYNISLEYENITSTKLIGYGVVSFDNIGTSFLTVFQVLTIFGWSEIMYNYMESNNSYLSAIFFSVLVLFGAFFLLNLILAVIVDAYNKIDMKEKKKEEEKLEEEAKKREKKFEAIKQMYRMMRLSQKKKEIIESAGLKFRWSFFDCVFELVRVERYEKVLNPIQKQPLKIVESIKMTFAKKLESGTEIPTKTGQSPVRESESSSQIKQSSINNNQDLNGLRTIQENDMEEDQDEEQKSNKLIKQISSSLSKRDSATPSRNDSQIIPLKDRKQLLNINTNKTTSLYPVTPSPNNQLDETSNNFGLMGGDYSFQKQDESMLNYDNTENMGELLSPIPKQFKSSYLANYSQLQQKNSMEVDQAKKKMRQSYSQEVDGQHSLRRIEEEEHCTEFHEVIVLVPKRYKIHSKAWIKVKEICLKIISTTFFKNLMSLLIIANTIFMSLDRYPIHPNEEQFETTANFIFYVFFVAELVLKIIGMSPKGYLKDGFNIFDALIILISTIDIVLNTVFNNSSSSTLSVLRGFRILRLLKIAKSQSKMQDFQHTIAKTLVDLRNFSVLLVLVVFTYTLLSLDFFAYKVKFDKYDRYDLENGVSPRLNFDGFVNAFTTVFCVLQGEGYHLIMYNVARSVGKVGILFFVTLIVFGNIILLKLFLAVLLENFEDKRKENEELKKSSIKKKFTQHTKKLLFAVLIKRIKCKCIKFKDPYLISEDEHHSSEQRSFIERANHIIHEKDRSLFIFSHENRFRKLVNKIACSKIFEYIILVLIILSSIFTAIQSPLEPTNTTKYRVLYYCDIVVTMIFAVEVILKIIAKGFIINGPSSYFHSFWNILDFIIVLVSILSIFASNSNENQKLFKILRLVRVLRPLRVIGRSEGLKLATQTLLMAIPNIMNVLLVSLIFYLIFGIFCVNFLKGKFYSCYTDHFEEYDIDIDVTTIITKFDCLNSGGEWINPEMNFDNALNAMQLLYSMTAVSWNTRMFNAVDATYVGYQPITNFNTWWILYFVVFMLIFVFFLLNLFVGVVVSTFNNEKERLGRNFLLTDTQKEWLHMKMMLLNTKPVIKKIMKGSNIVRRICFKVINHPFFEWFIFACIIINTLVLTLNWYNIPNIMTQVVTIFNYVFACIFTIEAIFKITALGWPYFRDSWNKFDFIIVLATLLGIILDQTTSVSVGGKATIARAFRVARLFRIVKRAKVLKIITDTLIVTLPSLMNVGGLLFLILYIYSILGMQLFSGIKFNEGLDERSNFQYFGRSFLTLIKVATGEEWDVLLDGMTEPYSILNQCDQSYDASQYADTQVVNGCGVFFAKIYMLSFNLLVSVIFLNLFVAIVLHSFEEMNKKENKLLSDSNMDHLRHCWAEFDQEGTSFIELDDFIPFLTMLGEPLGFSEIQRSSTKNQDDFMKQLLLPTYNGMKHFYYYDVIQVLTQYAYLKLESERKLKQQLMQEEFNFDKLTVEILNSIKSELEFTSEVFRAKEIVAFKEAMEKERNIYSKMHLVKDDLDSQHFWAGGRIKNMYGKTNMQFKGGNLQQQSIPVGEEEKHVQHEATEEVKEVKEDSKTSTPIKDAKPLSFMQIRKQSTKNMLAAAKNDGSTTNKNSNKNVGNRRKSLWNTLSQAITPEEQENVSLPILNSSMYPSFGMPTPHKKRSSIMLPMIAKAGDHRQSFLGNIGKQQSIDKNKGYGGDMTVKSGFGLDNIQEEEGGDGDELNCSSSSSSDSASKSVTPSQSSKSSNNNSSSHQNSDATYNIHEHDKHFKQPKQKQFHKGQMQKHQNFQLHPALIQQFGALHQQRRTQNVVSDTFETRIIQHSADRDAEIQKNNRSSVLVQQDGQHLKPIQQIKRGLSNSTYSGISHLQQELEEVKEEEFDELNDKDDKGKSEEGHNFNKKWTQNLENDLHFGHNQAYLREQSNLPGTVKKEKRPMKERISDRSLMFVEGTPIIQMKKIKEKQKSNFNKRQKSSNEVEMQYIIDVQEMMDDLSDAKEKETQ